MKYLLDGHQLGLGKYVRYVFDQCPGGKEETWLITGTRALRAHGRLQWDIHDLPRCFPPLMLEHPIYTYGPIIYIVHASLC